MPAKRRGVPKVKKEVKSVSKSKESKALLNLTNAHKDYHKSQKRFTLALNSALLCIWEASVNTGEVWWSDNAHKILGVPKKDLRGSYQSLMKLLTPEDQKIISEEFKRCLKSNKLLFFRHRIKRSDQSIRWIEVVGRALRDRKGTVRKLTGTVQDITEIKQGDFERNEWKSRYKILADTSNQVIYDHDIMTGRITWSGPVKEVLGFSDNELATVPRYEKQIHREDIKYRVSQLDIGKHRLKPYDIRYRFKTKSRQYITLRDRGIFLLDEKSRVYRALGTVQDISDKIRVETDLLESNRFKERMENAMPGLLYVNDVKTRSNIYVNHNITRMLGYSWEEIEEMGNNITQQLVHPEDVSNLTEWNSEPSRTVKDSEYRLKTKSGEWRWFRSRDTVFRRDEKGNVTQIIGVAQDITERKKMEEDLKESEARFRTLQEASFGGIGLHDQGLIIDCNQGLSAITGYTREELLGSDGIRLIAPEYRELVMNNILSGYEKPYDAEGIRKDGTRYSLEICGKNIPYKDRNIRVTEFRDITDRKLIEQKIIEQNARLQSLMIDLRKKNDQLEEFTQIVSHNLRSPMGNMLTLITFMETAKTEEDREQYMTYLKESSSKALTTLEELNEVLKLKQNENIEKQLLYFENVFNQVKAMISAKIAETSAEIRFDFSQAPSIHYPNIYLESIFLNLLTNALKYSDPGQRPVIDVKTYNRDNDILLEVSDNGLGINLERYGHQIFKLQKTFHKHPESRGIGLFMIKNQIEAMGGEISVESQEGIGTTFFVNFNKHHAT